MRSEWIFMADIWLHRKQELIRVINQVTDTDHDDLDMSVVLNVLWTAEDEERDYLNAVLTGMISGSFDDSHYSRRFLEQLDLICSVPIKVDDYHEEDDDSEEPELEDDAEDSVISSGSNSDHSWLICFTSLSAVVFSLYLNKATFNKEAMLAALPKWPYFWFEFTLVVIGFIVTAYIIKSIVNSIADHLATIGYLLLFMPLLCIVKGFAFSSSFWLYSCWGLSVIFIASLSRICSQKTIG